MKFAICNEIFKGWDLQRTFAFVKRCGYDGIEIAPFTIAPHVTDISSDERRLIRETAERNQLAITGIHWVLVETAGMYLTSPDPEVRARTAVYFCELVRFCSDIGGKIIVVGSPKQRNLQAGVTYEQAWQFAIETFSPSVKAAELAGITICFEPLSPVETDFVNTAEEAIRFAGEFKSPAMSVILDVKAMCSEQKSIPEIVGNSTGKFSYFHANDKNLKGPGFGEVKFEPIAKALRAASYDGYVSVEVFNFEEGPEAIAERSLGYLQKVFAE